MNMAFDPNTTFILLQNKCDLPMPADNHLWYATSSQDWDMKGGPHAHATKTSLWYVVKTVLLGQRLSIHTSSFGLLAIISTILIYISNYERVSFGVFQGYDNDFKERMERSITAWEHVWRLHPGAEQVSSLHGDQLLADCFAVLGSACYHLYLGPELQALKKIANEPNSSASLPPYKPTSFVIKAVKYAVNSWLVRAKLGVLHLKRTAALSHGGHVTVTAYEGGKLTCSSVKLVNRVTKVSSSDTILVAVHEQRWRSSDDSYSDHPQGCHR
jgi:hypothetical protein